MRKYGKIHQFEHVIRNVMKFYYQLCFLYNSASVYMRAFSHLCSIVTRDLTTYASRHGQCADAKVSKYLFYYLNELAF